MPKNYRLLPILTLLLLILTGFTPIQASEPIRPEIRALWVDAFHDGIKTPEQVDKLIADSLTANINTLIVQVRRRGDAYYNLSLEPRTEDPALQPGFDTLQDLVAKAHAHHIEVHAWLNTLVAWNKSTPPQDPGHVWNLHGPKAEGKDNWVSYYRNYNKTKSIWSDKLYSSYYLDPGNPDAVDYTVAVYLNVVKNYDIDGIHLDYSRYADVGWGYNRISIARYNAQFGAKGLPAPDDPQWLQWKREQTANLMRKIYFNTIALKPNLKVSSAVITWGDGPVAEGDWEKSRAYNTVCQDWRKWLEEGIIDLAIPMNYFNEWNSTQQLWYNHWIEWEKDHQYDRQIVIGPGIFSNYIENSLAQIQKAQTPSALGNNAAGVCLFAYGWSNLYSNDDYQDNSSKILPRQPYVNCPESNNWIYSLLANRGRYFDPATQAEIATEPVFPTPVPVPEMPWKTRPVNGYLMGTVSVPNGKTLDHLKIIIASIEPPESNHPSLQREAYTDGNGWFGITDLPPGDYQVTITAPGLNSLPARTVTVQAGKVAEVGWGKDS